MAVRLDANMADLACRAVDPAHFAYQDYDCFPQAPLVAEKIMLESELLVGDADQAVTGALRTLAAAWTVINFCRRLVVNVVFIAVIAFLIRLVQPLGTSVMNMQLGYFSSYVVLFVAGLWAGRNGFLQAIPAQLGRTWLWVAIGVGLPLWMILQGLGGALEGKRELFSGGWHWQAAGIAAWEAFFCVAFSIGLLTGMVQAYIFSVLATVYIAAAMSDKESRKEQTAQQ